MTNEHAWGGTRPRHALRLILALLGTLATSVAIGVAMSVTAGAEPPDPSKGDGLREYRVPATNPEGIVYDKMTKAFYGGSTGDGTVYKAKLDGINANPQVFMRPGEDGEGNPDNRTTTAGFNVDRQDRLYIAGQLSGLLNVYQLPRGNKIATFDVNTINPEQGPPYINDVEVRKNGDVYFTDSQRPLIYRVTARQVENGGGTPEAIPTTPEVDNLPNPQNDNPLENNGIRETPDGKYIIFGSLDDQKLFRMTPPPKGSPEDRVIRPIDVTGASNKVDDAGGDVGDVDGLEFFDFNTLYAIDNDGEVLLKIQFSSTNYLTGTVRMERTSPEFRTPTTMSLAPGGEGDPNRRLLITQAEFFDNSEPGPPFFVTSIRRP